MRSSRVKGKEVVAVVKGFQRLSIACHAHCINLDILRKAWKDRILPQVQQAQIKSALMSCLIKLFSCLKPAQRFQGLTLLLTEDVADFHSRCTLQLC